MNQDSLTNILLTFPFVATIYGFYFICQFLGMRKGARELRVGIERNISYNPHWVWIYSGIYYPIMFLPCILTDTNGMMVVWFSGAVLMALQAPFFIFYPIKTPAAWRKKTYKNISEWVLVKLVQRIDNSNNCFPSMHVSVATLVGLHICQFLDSRWYAIVAFFPISIAWSCLKTKQHYLIDLLPAPLLAIVAYIISRVVLW